MKWVNKKPDLTAISISDAFSGYTVLSLLELMSSSVDTPHVFMSDVVKKVIMDHINDNATESGGLLLGEVISLDDLESGIIAVKVTEAVPSYDFDATSVSLSMGPAVWDAARARTTKHNFVVGWYHSHPNLGAFFSGTDRKTQAEFFNKNYHLGLVIDPIRDEECWFVGEDSQSISLDNIWGDNDELSMV
ncbi:Mov34/MPN/PAD-1 family protein [Vibrio crassostreae]|uniref:Mov34/MPN/PAD-1 family protein n=1 Tax=Vibrio crassostreae TaxID=246167 RepID=UPI000F47C766|nr:Mov34/MPN/PAD-1 family protein [Vibrio crassostreae]ROO77084.1 proteasome lid subunit RPN8/RPN11 [Vibrio crassostreae]ROR75345.1 proteasome lid subunit RPN8/RPN11 [Vibrio crassostreae]TCV32794.1 proteasome lid subunit RPN8/RPN11 [Vibrio crassostreae]